MKTRVEIHYKKYKYKSLAIYRYRRREKLEKICDNIYHEIVNSTEKLTKAKLKVIAENLINVLKTLEEGEARTCLIIVSHIGEDESEYIVKYIEKTLKVNKLNPCTFIEAWEKIKGDLN